MVIRKLNLHSSEKTKPTQFRRKLNLHSLEKTKPVYSLKKTKPAYSLEKTKPANSLEKTKPAYSLEKTKPAQFRENKTCIVQRKLNLYGLRNLNLLNFQKINKTYIALQKKLNIFRGK